MDHHNDRIRELLMAGAHEDGDMQALCSEIAQADLFAVFTGDMSNDHHPVGINLELTKQVLPVFTHEEIARSNMRLDPGSWIDVISIRQAIHYVAAHQWTGICLNFRQREWMIEGDYLRYLLEIIPGASYSTSHE